MLQVISVIALIVVMMSMVSLGQRVLSQKKLTITILVVFFLYLIGQLYCTLFSRVPGSGSVIELSPFMSIVRLFSKPIEESGEVTGFFAWFMQGALPGSGIILNILLFVPLGYLLSILIPKWKSKHIILLGCVCSMTTELGQYLLKMGYFEIDDIIYNTLGTAVGIGLWQLQKKRQNHFQRSKQE